VEKIRKGVSCFHDTIFPKQKEHFEQLARQQRPNALFITCSDSRIHPNLITQTDPGDLFILRNPGNIVPPYNASDPGSEAATIEYAVAVLQVPNIIVCGHSNCGAMDALLRRGELNQLPAVVSWLHYAETTLRVMQTCFTDLKDTERMDVTIEQNVLMQLDNLKTHPSVAARLAAKDLQVFAWVYEIGTGDIREHNAASGRFVSLTRPPSANQA
jgi:carbonic anhydrase